VKRKSGDPLAKALALPDGPRKTAAIVAWIQGLYESKPPILVGGAAVELYTGGAYTTGDLDFVGDVPDSVAKALAKAGFERKGRHWIRDEGEIYLEFPGSAIQQYEKTSLLDVGGTRVVTLSAEDMIIDRLAAWQFWRSTTDGASAFLIRRSQKDRLDRRRLRDLAGRRKVRRALERLESFVGEEGTSASAEQVERWAGELP
jgi:hypothetical protein